jgi:hypothetical protein
MESPITVLIVLAITILGATALTALVLHFLGVF